jgi:hypothetical protein
MTTLWVPSGVSIPHVLVPIRIIALIIICEQVLIIILICTFRYLLIGLEVKAVNASLHTNISKFWYFLCPK